MLPEEEKKQKIDMLYHITDFFEEFCYGKMMEVICCKFKTLLFISQMLG